MAININTVYKTVLSIMNKEQRGFLTPDEFNKIAKQVQLNLIDKTFYDLNRQYNLKNSRAISAGDGDTTENIREKLDYLHKTSDITFTSNTATLPADAYKILEVVSTGRTKVYEEIKRHELNYLLSSKLTAPSTTFPAFYKNTAGTTITGSPAITDATDLTVSYIKYPIDPRFGYSRDTTYGTYVYDSGAFTAGGIAIQPGLTNSITINQIDFIDNTYTGTIGVTDGYSTSGSGAGGAISIVVSGNTVTSITVTATGSSFAIGDTIEVTGSGGVLGGSIGNLLITLAANNLYSSSTYGSINFELHPSEEMSLINGVLAYAGVVIRDPNITNLAGNIIQSTEQAKQ